MEKERNLSERKQQQEESEQIRTMGARMTSVASFSKIQMISHLFFEGEP
jgi:hypothetical protein